MPFRRSAAAATCALAALVAGAAAAQGEVAPPPAASSAEAAKGGDAFAERYALLGRIAPRHAKDIAANDWSIGAETMDRDYSAYDGWKTYLGPLGAKRARLQSGWARTEPVAGRYDFGWMDPVVADMHAQGVSPWISLGYGNPAYAGGGSPLRQSALPTGEGRAAWLAYVRAIVTRYKGKVSAWEIWNEPDLADDFSGADYGRFAAETAKEIRKVDPTTPILLAGFTGGVLAERGGAVDFADEALRTFVEVGGRGLAQVVTYHSYAMNPDTTYAGLERFRERVRAIDPAWTLMQGENGAPSLNQQLFALSNQWWTEESQAKWMLRRMLGDNARGVVTSVFTMMELHYPPAAEAAAAFNRQAYRKTARWTLNSKGLLETKRYAPGTPQEDKAVLRAKVGYRAMQSITSVFDSRLEPVTGACTASAPGVVAYAWRREDGATAVALWRTTDRPGENPRHEASDVTCRGVTLPVDALYLDPLTSTAYATRGVIDGVVARGVPVYDSPVVLADPRLVEIW